MEHLDLVTTFVWRNDSQTLISAGKDSTLYQHVFEDAHRPANHANNHGLNINNKGDICSAISDYSIRSNTSSNSNGYGLAMNIASSSQFYADKINPFKKSSDLAERFKCTTSSMHIFYNKTRENSLSMDCFVDFASQYKLIGKNFLELCDHNANVALKLGRPQISRTWQIIRHLFTSNKPNGGSFDERNPDISESRSRHVSKGASEPRGEARLPSVTSLNSLWTGTRYHSGDVSEINDGFDVERPDPAALVGSFDNQSGFFSGEEENASAANFTTDFEITPTEALSDELDETKMFPDSFLRNPIDDSYLLSEIDVFSDQSKSHLFN